MELTLGLEPVYRRTAVWRDIKARMQALADGKGVLPLEIIDEARSLPAEFFRASPALLNVAFDSRDLMASWLPGHPQLGRTERYAYLTPATCKRGIRL